MQWLPPGNTRALAHISPSTSNKSASSPQTEFLQYQHFSNKNHLETHQDPNNPPPNRKSNKKTNKHKPN